MGSPVHRPPTKAALPPPVTRDPNLKPRHCSRNRRSSEGARDLSRADRFRPGSERAVLAFYRVRRSLGGPASVAHRDDRACTPATSESRSHFKPDFSRPSGDRPRDARGDGGTQFGDDITVTMTARSAAARARLDGLVQFLGSSDVVYGGGTGPCHAGLSDYSFSIANWAVGWEEDLRVRRTAKPGRRCRRTTPSRTLHGTVTGPASRPE